MSSHATIVLSPDPKGRFVEGIISGTPKPGTIMEVKAATEPVGGKHTWQVYQPGGDGQRNVGPLAILCEDRLQGKTVSDAYVSGTLGQLYFVQPGDEVQLLLQNQSGTADSFAIGDKLILDNGTGKGLATTGSPESEPFVVMETLAALTADALCHVIATGQ